jgi:hypothetical protein
LENKTAASFASILNIGWAAVHTQLDNIRVRDDPERRRSITFVGNITGLSMLLTDLAAKELEILTEAVPQAKQIGVLWNPAVRDER